MYILIFGDPDHTRVFVDLRPWLVDETMYRYTGNSRVAGFENVLYKL